MELPVLLAMWMGLRASEIRGLTWGDIDGDMLHVRQAIVEGEDGPVLKNKDLFRRPVYPYPQAHQGRAGRPAEDG